MGRKIKYLATFWIILAAGSHFPKIQNFTVHNRIFIIFV